MQFTCDCGMPVFPPWPFQQVANVLGASESRPGPISQLLTSDRFREGCQGARALMASSEARALGLIMSWNSALCKPGWTPTLKPEYLDVCANSQGTSQPIGCSALIKALLAFHFLWKKVNLSCNLLQSVVQASKLYSLKQQMVGGEQRSAQPEHSGMPVFFLKIVLLVTVTVLALYTILLGSLLSLCVWNLLYTCF